MKYLIVAFAVSMSLVLVSGQFFGPQFRGFQGYRGFRLNSLTSDFDPAAFTGGFSGPANIRDPRQNRGPVVFPPSPPNPLDETSGVVVGASGYGFVPPNGQSRNVAPAQPQPPSPSSSFASSINHFNSGSPSEFEGFSLY